MSAPETVTQLARRGIGALEHLLIAADIARTFAPAARAGDPEAVDLIRLAATHMRALGMTEIKEA